MLSHSGKVIIKPSFSSTIIGNLLQRYQYVNSYQSVKMFVTLSMLQCCCFQEARGCAHFPNLNVTANQILYLSILHRNPVNICTVECYWADEIHWRHRCRFVLILISWEEKKSVFVYFLRFSLKKTQANVALDDKYRLIAFSSLPV